MSAVQAVSNPLNNRVDFFGSKTFAQAPRSLQRSVEIMEAAQQSLIGLEAVALLLHSDEIARSTGEADLALDSRLREGLNFALVQLARHSHTELDQFSDALHNIYLGEVSVAKQKGGKS